MREKFDAEAAAAGPMPVYQKVKLTPEQMVGFLEQKRAADGRGEVIARINLFPVSPVGKLALTNLLADHEQAILEAVFDVDWDAVEVLISARHPTVIEDVERRQNEVIERAVAGAARTAFGGRQGGTPPAQNLN